MPIVVDTSHQIAIPAGLTVSMNIEAPFDPAAIITVTGVPVIGTVKLASGTVVNNGDILTHTQLTELQYEAQGPADGTGGNSGFSYKVENGGEDAIGFVDVSTVSSGSGVLYFAAQKPGSTDRALYKIEPGNASPEQITIGNGVGDHNPAEFVNFGRDLIFNAWTNTNGNELYRLDYGSSTPTLIDIESGTDGSFPSGFTEFAGALYFSAVTAAAGREFYRLEAGSTTPDLININLGSGFSSPMDFIEFNGALYFAADSVLTGREIYRLEPDSLTPELIEIETGSGGAVSSEIVELAGALYFSGFTSSNGNEIYRLDEGSSTPILIETVPGGDGVSPQDLFVASDTLYFRGDTAANGNELYRLDPGSSMPVLIDIETGSGDSLPDDFIEFDDALYFSAATGPTSRKLFRLDAGSNSPKQISISGNSDLDSVGFIVFDNALYFSAANGGTGSELFRLDAGSTTPVLIEIVNGIFGSFPTNFEVFDNALFFQASNISGEEGLYRLDADSSTPVLVDVNGDATPAPENLKTAGFVPVPEGTDGDDTLIGVWRDETISGGNGNDVLHGGVGDDILIGGNGNDVLHGGAGPDMDILVLNPGAETGQYAEISNFAMPTSTITIELLFQSGAPLPTDAGALPHFVSYALPGGDSNAITLFAYGAKTASGDIGFRFNGTTHLTGIPSQTLFDNSPHRLSIIFDAINDIVRFYLDGKEVFSEATTAAPVTAGGTLIFGQEQDIPGGGFDSSQITSGEIADIRIWNDVRTAQEISDNAFAFIADPVSEQGLVANWRPDSGMPGSVPDATGGTALTLKSLGGSPLPGFSNFDGGGNDVLDGGAGSDTADYSDAPSGVRVFLFDTNGQDTLGAGFDTHIDIENLIGSAFDDILRGDIGDNVLEGGDGDDELNGGVNSSGGDTADYSSASSGVRVLLSDTNGQNTLGAGRDTLIGIENLIGSDHDDSLYGDGGDNLLEGGDGADRIVAGDGNDTLRGGAGNDILKGRGGDDMLFGDAGDDILFADAGVDALFGGADNDLLYGGSSNDELNGNIGNDRLRGNLNNDILNGGHGDDLLFGGGQNDTLNGGLGDDNLRGENGNDILDGGSGDDVLFGNGLIGEPLAMRTFSFSRPAMRLTVFVTGKMEPT